MGIDVDFTGVEATPGGGPVAEGEYRCRIDEAKEKVASTGTPGVEVVLKIMGGEYDGRLLWDTIWISDKALGVARWKLQCAGLKVPDGPFRLEARQLVGRVIKATVRHEEYDGKFRARVKAWDEAEGAAGPAPAPRTGDDDIPF
jgi:hypothetical protein